MRLNEVRVALVDDDDSVRRAVGRLLRASGMEVDVYASGSEFLDDLENHLPHCVVLDMCMPSMSGLEVQAGLAARHICLPIVIITAHDDPVVEQRALDAGATICLHKPFPEEVLLAAIASATGAEVRRNQ